MGREELNEGMVAEEQDEEGVFTVERMTRIKKEKKHPSYFSLWKDILVGGME